MCLAEKTIGVTPIAHMARRTSTFVLWIALLAVFISRAPLAWPQSGGTIGYQVKAAFLLNFAKFIDWSPGTFANPQSPLVVCVLGQDPFGNILDDTLQGKAIGDRPFIVRRLKDKIDARHCQMVFVSSSESPHLPEILESLRGANVVVVGEANGFATSGGMIEFTIEDNHVRFSINTDAANRSGLKFSSKLLALARIVHDGSPAKGE